MITTNEIPEVTNELSWYLYDEKLRQRFTTVSRFDDKIELFKIVGHHLLLPRGACPLGKVDKRSTGIPCEFSHAIKPRNDDQLRVFHESKVFLDKGESGIVKAPTGFGKTVVGYNIIAHLQTKTLIIVTKEDLLYQWTQDAQKFLGLSPKEIGRIQGDICNTAGKKLVVGMIQSVCREKYPAYLFRDFGLTIWDECHRASADKFRRSIDCSPSKWRVGLTAENKRQDGKEVVFESHIGPVRVETEAQLMVPKVVRVRSDWVPKPWQNSTTPDRMMGVYVSMTQSFERNSLIVRWIKKCYDEGRNTVVFSDLAVDKYLNTLRLLCVKEGIPNEHIGYYVGGMTQKAKDKAASKRVILSTYSASSEGTNYPWWDACVFTTPRSKVLQPIGRIRREYPDKKTPIVVDVVDVNHAICKQFARGRKRWYKDIGAEIIGNI